MSSKAFDSILNTAPAATVETNKQTNRVNQITKKEKPEELFKIVARVPLSLKEDLRNYIRNNKGETEAALIIKGLIKLGFKIENDFTLDRRKLR
jgi:hypothetical protein